MALVGGDGCEPGSNAGGCSRVGLGRVLLCLGDRSDYLHYDDPIEYIRKHQSHRYPRRVPPRSHRSSHFGRFTVVWRLCEVYEYKSAAVDLFVAISGPYDLALLIEDRALTRAYAPPTKGVVVARGGIQFRFLGMIVR